MHLSFCAHAGNFLVRFISAEKDNKEVQFIYKYRGSGYIVNLNIAEKLYENVADLKDVVNQFIDVKVIKNDNTSLVKTFSLQECEHREHSEASEDGRLEIIFANKEFKLLYFPPRPSDEAFLYCVINMEYEIK